MTGPARCGRTAPAEPTRRGKPSTGCAELRGLALMLLGVLAFHTSSPSRSTSRRSRWCRTCWSATGWWSASIPTAGAGSRPRSTCCRAATGGSGPRRPNTATSSSPCRPTATRTTSSAWSPCPATASRWSTARSSSTASRCRRRSSRRSRMPVDADQPCDAACLASSARRDARCRRARVYELPTLRETLPNGASYLIIDHLDQPLDNYARDRACPTGHVFLMGDNRDHSADSRADAVGERASADRCRWPNIGGRAEFITFSLDGSAELEPADLVARLRADRAWRSLRPRSMRGKQPPKAEDDRWRKTERPSSRAGADDERRPARPTSPTRCCATRRKRALVWVGDDRRWPCWRSILVAVAAGDLRRRWCSPR